MRVDTSFRSSSAVLLIHATPGMGGAIPICNGDGGLASAVVHNLDYNGRQGVYEERGGCDRGVTEDDRRITAEQRELGLHQGDFGLSGWLDYTAREGAFSEKGGMDHADCTYFSEDGPVSREDIVRSMLGCGGCMHRSVLTVSRESAERLGLSDKQGFERLMRDTWTRSVCDTWGVTDNPASVHWFANFHTDQPNNLHVHITTWFDRGLFTEEGWTVTAAATRAQKAQVYEVAYAPVVREHLPEKDFLRSYLISQAKAELGLYIPERDVERLGRKAAESGMGGYHLGRTVSDKDAAYLGARVDRVRELYAEGDGRISRNYALQAAARDVVDALNSRSAAFSDAWDDYRYIVGVQADSHGLAVSDGSDDPSLEIDAGERRAREVARHERDRFIRREMVGLRDGRDQGSLKQRIASQLIRASVPEEVRRDLVRGTAKEIAPFGEVVAEMKAIVERGVSRLGLDAGQVDAVRAAAMEGPSEGRVGRIAETIAAAPALQERIAEAAATYTEQAVERHAAPSDPVRELTSAVRRQVESAVGWAWERDAVRDPREVAVLEGAREVSRMGDRGILHSALAEQGIALGLSLDGHQTVRDAVADMLAPGAPQEVIEDAVARAATVIVESPVMRERIADAAARMAERLPIAQDEARERIAGEVHRRTAQAVRHQAPYVQEQVSYQVPEQGWTQSASLSAPVGYQGVDLGSTIAMLADAAASSLVRGAAAAAMRRGRGNERDQQYVETVREREM